MTTPQYPPAPGVPGIPIMNNLNPAPGVGGVQTYTQQPPAQPETYTWAQLLASSNIQQQTIPSAYYDAQVIDAQPGQAGNKKDMAIVTFQLISGQFAGKKYTRNFVVSPDSPKGMRVFFRQMMCMGADDQFFQSLGEIAIAQTIPQICQRIMGAMCRIEIKQKEFPPSSGLFDNEVGFVREPIMGGASQMPSMINQGAPAMPQFIQPQQPQYQQPQYPQGYAQPVQDQQQYAQPQQYPPPGQQYMTSSTEQPMQAAPVSPYAQQVPPQPPQVAQNYSQPPQQPAPQLQPTQMLPVGPEHVQAQPQQQYAPPPPPGPPPFESMLREPQQGTQQAPGLTPPPSPYQQQGQPAQAQEATPADAQPQPQQLSAEQYAQFQAMLAAQQGQQAPPTGQPQAPPIPRDF